MRDVGVVVLSYGPDNGAAQVIAALCGDGRVGAEQIVQVHNPSAPGERAEPEAAQHVLDLPRNVGYAGGMNAGIAQLAARYEFILLLTHDVRIGGAAVQRLRDALAEHPELGIVGPLLQSERGQVWSAGKQRTSDWEFVHVGPEQAGAGIRPVDSLDGSVLMARSADLAALRFDPRLFMYFEETDLIERLRGAGAGSAAIVTAASAESTPGVGRRPLSNAYLMSRNGLYVAFRHGGWGGALRFAATKLSRDLLRLLSNPRNAPRPYSRRFAAQQLAATCAGLLDGVRRRFGPPPQRLRDGDLRV